MPRRRAAILSAISLIVASLAGCDGGSDVGRGETVAASAPAAPPSAGDPAGAGASAAESSPVPGAPAAPTGPAAPTPPAELGPVHRLVVRDLDGNEFPLSRLAGRPMIIEIWATWCGPCRKNRATVHGLLPTFPKRLAVVGISVDTGPDLVRNFLRSNTANEFELMATPEFMEFVRTRNASPSIPKTMYVDSKGRVADLSEGTQSAKWLEAMARNLR
ncbi:MAG: TlpA family protein disulfide reductase [Planctomycetaceae bacterium]|nr:TlpA family protein disulfide reductase [Planctomycetaceae bacterium]